MTKEEVKQSIIDNVKWDRIYPSINTNMRTGKIEYPKLRMISEELGLSITLDYYRNPDTNKALIDDLLSFAIDKLIK
jgi:hypothetical protein